MDEDKKRIPLEPVSARAEWELLPTFEAELEEIRENGISESLIYDIIQKHINNAEYNKQLYRRYMAISNGVPIFSRMPMNKHERKINNRINNDFFGEIIDFKTGYFAGQPITYSYSKTEESEETTGGEESVKIANKTVTDFVTRNNMFGVDMETTKNASIYGYSGRLFYIDSEGMERVMPVHGFETIILTDTDISEPECAIRYYKTIGLKNEEIWHVDYYDNKNVTKYKGASLLDLQEIETKPHLFDYCPLQGIANNKECLGDAERVLAEIDAYDKVVSDNSNEIESFVHALLVSSILGNDFEKVLQQAQESGILNIPPIGTNQVNEPVRWLTKNINDAFTEHQLERLEKNIYRFSKTPNLNDETFNTASGISLKFKLHGLEQKCAAFEASVMNSAQHMWKVLGSAWAKKGIKFDPLQATMEFTRNFPQDDLSNAQTIQAYIAAGLPKEWAFSQIPGVDDVQYILELLEKEKEDAMEMYPANIPMNKDDNQDDKDDNNDNNDINDKEDDAL